ncbi:MAG: hypothetical protein WC861_04435 [Candidatus Micrarchaeia archaeon]|jgi:hypothetical protein
MANAKVKREAVKTDAITSQARSLSAFSRRLAGRGHAKDSEKNEYKDLAWNFGLALAAEAREPILKSRHAKESGPLRIEFAVLANAGEDFMKPVSTDGMCDCPGGYTIGETARIDARGNGKFTFTIPRLMGSGPITDIGGMEIDLKEGKVSVTYPNKEKEAGALADIGQAFAKYIEALVG